MTASPKRRPLPAGDEIRYGGEEDAEDNTGCDRDVDAEPLPLDEHITRQPADKGDSATQHNEETDDEQDGAPHHQDLAQAGEIVHKRALIGA